ncbi:hypothetical protein MOQ_005163 [Trypanosoma cruzi marinkellei]|uniref:Uncharacterized protein n=1 Tax=Trypanosoma cruzi marinkellei TaxID=85056 RepID=K2M7J0_TRYCR|nr:hypothetical protein MOQ_005163 [Trypanosoma cruzi marinkellei]
MSLVRRTKDPTSHLLKTLPVYMDHAFQCGPLPNALTFKLRLQLSSQPPPSSSAPFEELTLTHGHVPPRRLSPDVKLSPPFPIFFGHNSIVFSCQWRKVTKSLATAQNNNNNNPEENGVSSVSKVKCRVVYSAHDVSLPQEHKSGLISTHEGGGEKEKKRKNKCTLPINIPNVVPSLWVPFPQICVCVLSELHAYEKGTRCKGPQPTNRLFPVRVERKEEKRKKGHNTHTRKTFLKPE